MRALCDVCLCLSCLCFVAFVASHPFINAHAPCVLFVRHTLLFWSAMYSQWPISICVNGCSVCVFWNRTAVCLSLYYVGQHLLLFCGFFDALPCLRSRRAKAVSILRINKKHERHYSHFDCGSRRRRRDRKMTMKP